jgi:hypothetical protein
MQAGHSGTAAPEASESMGTMHDPDDRERADGPRPPFQFRLRTLFIITTVFAVASAGFARLSLAGAVLAVLGAWMMLEGVVCLGTAVRAKEEPITGVLGLLLGIVYIALGGAVFGSCVF